MVTLMHEINMKPIQNKKVYIVILNWNSWQDTVECLESVFHLHYPAFQVIVCDNASSDDSLHKIKMWARGEQSVYSLSKDERLTNLISRSVQKPIGYAEFDRVEAERGGTVNDREFPLILIQTGKNLGFAGGNNVGIRYALRRDDFDYLWILNNDTLVDPQALSFLVQKMESEPGAGICGSKLLYYHRPDEIESAGGSRYEKSRAWTYHLESGEPASKQLNEDDISGKMSYVDGASMLVTRNFLNQIGLMSEDYFLYYEELDWAIRSRNHFTMTFSENSIVYHKHGATVIPGSIIAAYFLCRNRVLITKKYFPLWLPIIICRVFYELMRSLYPRKTILLRIILCSLIGVVPREVKDLIGS
jgi:hypothetical protein